MNSPNIIAENQPKNGRNCLGVLYFLIWLITSVVIWISSLLMLRGMYPDWDDTVGEQMGWVIRGVLIISWGFWFITLFVKSKKKLNVWFMIGVCVALFLSVVRLFFFREMIELMNLIFRNGHR